MASPQRPSSLTRRPPSFSHQVCDCGSPQDTPSTFTCQGRGFSRRSNWDPNSGALYQSGGFQSSAGKDPNSNRLKQERAFVLKTARGPCIRCSNNTTLLSGRFPNHLGADTPTARADTPMQHTLSQELPENPGPTSHWLEWVSDSWGALAWSYRLKSSPCHPTWVPKGKQHCPRSFPRTLHQLVQGVGKGATMRSLGLGGGSVQSARCPWHV